MTGRHYFIADYKKSIKCAEFRDDAEIICATFIQKRIKHLNIVHQRTAYGLDAEKLLADILAKEIQREIDEAIVQAIKVISKNDNQ